MNRRVLVFLAASAFSASGAAMGQIGMPCNESIWRYIHSPGRFRVASHCVSIRAVVEKAGRNFYDGDAIFDLRPDPESAIALRKIDPKMDDLRIKRQGGLIRVEVICAYATKAKWWICSGYQNRVSLPKSGDSVVISGSYVRDGHARIELHGPTAVEILRTASRP